jgi:hypothetical protein
MKSNVRHHAVHPPINVKPSAVNKKPGTYTPAEKAGSNVNPSLPGPVGSVDPEDIDDIEEEDRGPKIDIS